MNVFFSSVLVLTSALMLTFFQNAHAARGDWYELDTAKLMIEAPNGLEAFDKSFDDLGAILNAYKPKDASVTDRQFIKKGPNGLPRISFKASPSVAWLPDPTLSVRADVTRGEIDCRNWGVYKLQFEARGFFINMDLSDSEDAVTDQASNLLIETCFIINADGSLYVAGRALMQEGADFGWKAGPMAKTFFKKQTKPLLKALQEVARKYRVLATR